MKHLILTAFGVLLLNWITSSCNSDDPSPSGDGLVGSWKLTDSHCDDGLTIEDPFGANDSIHYTFTGKDYHTVFTFTDTPNEFTASGVFTSTYTTVTNGQQHTFDVEVDPPGGTGTWSMANDQLTQRIEGDTTLSDILELNSSSLKLVQHLDDVHDDNGTLVHVIATVYTSYSRQ